MADVQRLNVNRYAGARTHVLLIKDKSFKGFTYTET